jgi:CheY-like chemotaxis protein
MRKAGRKRVLVVEDDAHVAHLLEVLLEKLDVDVERAADGASAVAAAAERPPDLILADVRLPDMTGLEAVRLIRERRPTPPIPVVVLTGHANPENIKEAVDLGVVDFLTKPKSLSPQGMERVRQILEPEPAKKKKRGDR